MTFMMVIVQVMMVMSMWATMMSMNMKTKSNTKTMNPFECGYNPPTSKMPLSIQFTMLVIMFLLFDIELSILISLNWKMPNMNKSWLFTTFMFLMAMVISIAYEMTKKSFKWN